VNRPHLEPAGDKTVLITFWVSVPPKTKPGDFFDFLQQQGYLRIWLNGEIVRVDRKQNIERLGARVQVVQDRITINEQNRARLIEAIETALRFGRGKVNIVADAVEAGSPQDESVRLADVLPATSMPAAGTAATTASEIPFS